MKICPYCAEEIQDEAIKCRYCNEFLNETKRSMNPYVPPALPTATENPLPWYFKTSFLVLTFLMVPPFVLPSVWLHPKLSLIWKIVITAAVIGFCWATYVAFEEFVHQLDEATKMLNGFKP